MYCVKCGVELADSEKKCPLCGTPVFHPDIPRNLSEPPFPPDKRIRPEDVNRYGVLFVLTIAALLLAGVERVTLGANFNLDVLLGRTSLNNCTTRASDSRLFVLGMDTFLHGFHLSHQISVKRQTALPLVQTLEYSSTECVRMQG